MLKLIGSVMIFGSCAALGLNARRELRRRVAAADAMLLALRLMESEIASRRTPMPEIIDLLAKNENQVVRRIFSGLSRRLRERSGLSLGVFERVMVISCKDGKRFYRMEKTEGLQC